LVRYLARATEILAALCLLVIVLVKVTGGFSLPGIDLHRTANPWRFLGIMLALRLALAVPGWLRHLRRWISGNRTAALLGLLVLVTASVPRLYDLSGSSLNSDELLWIDRGAHMFEMLRTGQLLGATEHLGHPGATTAFLVGHFSNWLGRGASGAGLGLMDPVAAARLPMAVLGVLACVLLFFVGRKIWPERVAFLAALFLASDPVHVGLSRLVHVDGCLTFFFMMTVLAYTAGEIGGDWRWKAASGLFFGCAILTKTPAFLLPGLLLVWKAVVWLKKGKARGAIIGPGDVACVMLGYLMYTICFTRTWLEPASVFWIKSGTGYAPYEMMRAVCLFLQRVPVAEAAVALLVVCRLVAWRRTEDRGGLRGLLFPRGATWRWLGIAALALLWLRLFPNQVQNTVILLKRTGRMGFVGETMPGKVLGGFHAPPYYYPLLLSVRLSVLLVVSVVTGLGVALRRVMADRKLAARAMIPVVAAVGFIVFLSAGRRVAMRYILPAVPFICLLGAIGLDAAAEGVGRLLDPNRRAGARAFLGGVCVLLVLGVQVTSLCFYAPNYYLFFNKFIGGPGPASEHMVVGWGEGYKEVTSALKELSPAKEINVTVLGELSPIRFYWDHGSPPADAKANIGNRAPDEADYVIVILNIVQTRPRTSILERLEGRRPIHTVNLKGVDLAWIYSHEKVPVKEKMSYKASSRDLDLGVGRREEDPLLSGKKVFTGRVGRDEEGWIMRGPHRTYAPGEYDARFRVRIGEDAPAGEIGVLEISADNGGFVLGRKSLTADDFERKGEYSDFHLPFTLDEQKVIEFRVYFRGTADVWVYGIKVRPAGDQDR